MTGHQIQIRSHELRTGGYVVVNPGQTLEAMLRESIGGRELREDVKVRMCGRNVPRKLWSRIKPKPGTEILAYTTETLHGSTARQIIGAVIMIAVAWWAATAIAAVGAGGTVFGLAGAAGYAAVAGVYMLSTLAVNALTKPPTPGAAQGTDGAFRALTGSGNQYNPWGVIPFVIGESRHYPPKPVLEYTETVGESSYLIAQFDAGHGELETPTADQILLGDTPLTSFTGYQWEFTRNPTLYVNDVSEARVDAVMEHEDHAPVLRTTAPNTERISFDLIYPEGHFGVGTSGKTFSMWTAWRIRYRAVGETSWTTPTDAQRSGFSTSPPTIPAAIAGANFWVQSTKKKPFGCTLAWDVPAGQYEVEITRMGSLRGGSANQYMDAAAWTVLRSIKRGDASRTGTNKLVLRIKANDQVQGNIGNLTVLLRQKIRSWDRDTGTWSEPHVNLNPAWVVHWLLTECPGVGTHVDPARIDLHSFADFADYCDANSFEARGVCDSPQLLIDLVNDVLACALGSLGTRDGLYSIVFDPGAVQPSMRFTPAETADFRFSCAFVEMPQALRVQFVNPDADWQQDEIIVLDDGYSYRGVDTRGNPSSAPEPERFETLQLRYAADAIHAWRVGRYHFAQAKFRNATYTWTSDIAGLGVVRGDCVEVPNDVLEWGAGSARVVGLTAGSSFPGAAATVALDSSLESEAGTTYRMVFRRSDGSAVDAQLAAAGGETNVYALTTLPAGVKAGDMATLVAVSRELQPLLVTNVEYDGAPTEEGFATRFTAVAYDARVAPYWANPPGTIVSEITGRATGVPSAPIIDGVVSSPEHDDEDDAGIVGPVIRIGVRRPSRTHEWRAAA